MNEKTTSPSRRNFLTRILVGWISVIILPMLYIIVEYLIPPRLRELLLQSINAGKLGDIPENSAKVVRFNKKAIILVHTEKSQIRAYSAVCTHLGCIVEYKPDQMHFKCNCHGSVFDINGRNISGPAPTPLQPYRVEVKQDEIIVTQI